MNSCPCFFQHRWKYNFEAGTVFPIKFPVHLHGLIRVFSGHSVGSQWPSYQTVWMCRLICLHWAHIQSCRKCCALAHLRFCDKCDTFWYFDDTLTSVSTMNSCIWNCASNSLVYFNIYHSLGNFSLTTNWRYFSYFSQKTGTEISCNANCLQWRQFAWNVKSCFPGKIRKNISIPYLLTILSSILSVTSVEWFVHKFSNNWDL